MYLFCLIILNLFQIYLGSYIFNFKLILIFVFYTFNVKYRKWNQIQYTNVRFCFVHSRWYSETFIYAVSLWFMAVLFAFSYPFNKITSIFPEWHYWDELFSSCCPDVLEYANFFVLIQLSLIFANVGNCLLPFIIITTT